MAHYALLDENNIVINVITGKDEGEDGINWEEHYGNFHNVTCKRTSYNTRLNQHIEGKTPYRGNYAQIGYKYYSNLDAFIPPKPYESWILDEEKCWWKAPVEYPVIDSENIKKYNWNEDILNWEEIQVSE